MQIVERFVSINGEGAHAGEPAAHAFCVRMLHAAKPARVLIRRRRSGASGLMISRLQRKRYRQKNLAGTAALLVKGPA